jgi:excisionase family DNA binding protein
MKRVPTAAYDVAPQYLSAAQSSQWSGLSLGYVYSLLRTGELRCSKVGRRKLIDRRDLEAFLAERRGVTVAELEATTPPSVPALTTSAHMQPCSQALRRSLPQEHDRVPAQR